MWHNAGLHNVFITVVDLRQPLGYCEIITIVDIGHRQKQADECHRRRELEDE